MSDRTLRASMLLTGALVAGLLAAGGPVVAAADQEADEFGLAKAGLDAPELGIEYVQEIRKGLNLAADREALRAAAQAERHELTDLVDIPLTTDEATEMLERAEFIQNVYDSVIGPLTDDPSFAGWHVDLADDAGTVEVLLVAPSMSQKRDLPTRAVDRRGSRQLKVTGATHSLVELETAMMDVWNVWERQFPDIVLHAVDVDVATNGLVVRVDPGQVDQVAAALTKRSLNGVAPDLTVAAGEPSVETACSSRDRCTSPMRAGNVMRRGSATSDDRCTMGFHVVSGSNRGWLSAGHCSYGSTRSNDWFHQGWVAPDNTPRRVGTVQSNAYGRTTTDAMRVSMPAAQASSRIYGRTELVGNWRNPGGGEMACGSLGRTNVVRCGEVTSGSTSWRGGFCECTVQGARANYATQPGDSGHPVFTIWTSTRVNAVGIGNTAGGHFARIDDAIARTGGWTPVVN